MDNDSKFIIEPIPEKLREELQAPETPQASEPQLPRILLPQPGDKMPTIADILDQLQNIDKKLAGISPDEISSLKQDLKSIRQELTEIHTYQRGIYQWLIAIGEQVGIKAANE